MHVDGGRREAHLGAEDPLERDEREEEHRVGAERVVLLGEKEWEAGNVRVKDLRTREEVDVNLDDLE